MSTAEYGIEASVAECKTTILLQRKMPVIFVFERITFNKIVQKCYYLNRELDAEQQWSSMSNGISICRENCQFAIKFIPNWV